jgi:hypothetical protein
MPLEEAIGTQRSLLELGECQDGPDGSRMTAGTSGLTSGLAAATGGSGWADSMTPRFDRCQEVAKPRSASRVDLP